MVICRYFLEGNCKFGSSCNFDHSINGSGTGVSILRQSTTQAAPMTADVNTLIRSVQSDMENAEKGGQWLLSSYAPFKEKPAFPNFEDKSFEEVRFGHLEALKTGAIEQYKQILQSEFHDALLKTRALQNPSADIINVLKTLYNTPVKNSAATTNTANPFQSTSTSVFGGATVFAQQTNSNPIFGGQAKATFGGFGAQNSIFGGQTATNSAFNSPLASQAQQTNSPFGAAAAQTPNNSPFGGSATQTQTNSPFGAIAAQAQSNSVFGGNAQQAPTNSPFGANAAQAQSNTPFGANTAQPQANAAFGSSIFSGATQATNSPLGGAASSSIFGNKAAYNQPFAGANQGIFSAQASSTASIFGGGATQPFQQAATAQAAPFQAAQQPFQQTAQPQFQQQAAISPFQNSQFSTQAQTNNSPFAQITPQQSASNSPFGAASNSQSIFGSQVNTVLQSPLAQPNPIFGGIAAPNQACDETLYSKLTDLSESDLNAFNSNSFEMGKIPELPPAVQLCF